MDLDGKKQTKKTGVLSWMVSMSEYNLIWIKGTVGPG